MMAKHLLRAMAVGVVIFLSTVGSNARAQSAPPPTGLVLVLENHAERPLNLSAVSNPYISGVALQIRWRDIEPSEGQVDWSRLDQVFEAANSSKKWVQLLIFPGFFSPSWALEGVRTGRFPVEYGPGAGTVMELPVPWDRVYLQRWFAFLKLLSARYGSNPSFRVMAADGPTSVSAEFTLPASRQDVDQWIGLSYTPQKYLEAWRRVFRTIGDDFPNQVISLSLGDGLKINNRGRRDPKERLQTQQAVIEEGIKALHRRFALQYSNLDGQQGKKKGERGTDLIISYNGRIITGLQLRTSCVRNSANMGAAGDPRLALQRSIDKGLRPGDGGKHIDYLEIYEPDVLAAETQPALRYGASRFAR